MVKPDEIRGLAVRREMVHLHRDLYRRQQRRILAAIDPATAGFRRYAARHAATFLAPWRRCQLDALVRAASRADIVYVGDYHSLPAAQASYASLVRAMPGGRPLTLALELFDVRVQAQLTRFLAGDADPSTVLGHSTLQPGGASWAIYAALLGQARAAGWRLLAVDSQAGDRTGSSLTRRDAVAAALLAQERRQRPERRILVLVGELHLAPAHLPQQVQAALGTAPGAGVLVYQNNPTLYERLLARGQGACTPCMRLGADRFCLFNTAPVVCQQSFLNCLDVSEDGAYVADPEQAFREHAQTIAAFFDLPLGNQLDAVAIETVMDLSLPARLRRRGDFSARDVQLIMRQIKRFDSAYIPRANLVYLGNHARHHVSEEASHFVRHSCIPGREPGGLVDAFYRRCIEEALGFLGSKIIDPGRGHVGERRWRILARAPSTLPERQLGRLLLRHLRMEAGHRVRGMAALYSCSPGRFNTVTHLLGYRLGDRLYRGLMQGQLSKAALRTLFRDPLEEEGEPLVAYLVLIRRTEPRSAPGGRSRPARG